MNTQVVQQVHDQFKTLRRAIRGNGTFSSDKRPYPGPWGQTDCQFMGVGPTAVFLILGIALIIFGVDLFWVASKNAIDRRLAWTAVIFDIIWVVASYTLLLGGWLPLTTAGNWTVALLDKTVAVFAIWQYIGLRRAAVAD